MIFAAPLELGENLLSFELPEAVIGGDSVSMTDPWWNFTMIDTKISLCGSVCAFPSSFHLTTWQSCVITLDILTFITISAPIPFVFRFASHFLPVIVLVGLYEEPERPPNAVDYIKRYMGAPTGVDVEAMKTEYERLKELTAQQEATIKDLNEKLQA